MRYLFGDCELSPNSQELFLSGGPRLAEPQVFDLLCHFVKKLGRLVSRDELIDHLSGSDRL